MQGEADMKRVKASSVISGLICLLIAQLNVPAIAADPGTYILANQDIAAELRVGNKTERVTGRISMYLLAAGDGRGPGQVAVGDMNLVFTGVTQQLLAPDAENVKPLGLLAFGLAPGEMQQLNYDARSGRLTGELRMFMDATFLAAYAEVTKKRTDDTFLTPTVPVTAEVEIDIGGGLNTPVDTFREAKGEISRLTLTSIPDELEVIKLPGLTLSLGPKQYVRWSLASVRYYEIGRSLCVRPVRLMLPTQLGSTLFIRYSGDGLYFGEPGASREWGKVDVTFDIQSWEDLPAGNQWIVNSVAEADELRSRFDEDDCIEVFFAQAFDPVSLMGGGGAWGKGTGSAQVVTSDGNAHGGIDKTHLAHELGHVLGLCHPGTGYSNSCGDYPRATKGTLMCPSGFLSDNPQVNSYENGQLLSNPLLQFSYKTVTPGWDCVDNNDCPDCPN